MLAEKASTRADTQVAETGRHNLADEGLRGKQIDVLDAERKAKDAETAANRKDISDSKVRDDGRAVAESIPGGTIIPETDPAVSQMRAGGMGSILRGMKSRPSVDVGPLQPGDTGEAVPVDSVLKLNSAKQGKEGPGYNMETKTVLYKGKPVDATWDPRQKSYSLPDGTDITSEVQHYEKPPTPDRVLIQSGDGYVPRSAAAKTLQEGGNVPLADPSQTRNRRDMATAVGSHFDDTNQLIDEADKRGLLGPLKGRTFTEFMAGKVGSTGNAEDDNLLGDLRTSLSMLRSGTASLHGRAGANQGIAKDIERKMDEGYMDPAMLKGSVNALRKWVTTYATPSKGGAAAPASGGDAYDEYLKRNK